jgi:hypothetical protein
MTVLRELSTYRLDLVACKLSDGRAVAPHQRENTISIESGMRTMK